MNESRLKPRSRVRNTIARARRIGKEGLWIAAGQIASVLGSLTLVRIITGYLEPAQYGQLALALTIAGLMNQLVTSGLVVGVGRFYPIAVEKSDLGAYKHACLKLAFNAFGIVVALGILISVTAAIAGYRDWAGLVVASTALSLTAATNAAISGIQNAARQRAVVALHTALDAWLKIAFASGAVALFGALSVSVVVGYLLSSVLVTISQVVFLGRLFRLRGSLITRREQTTPTQWDKDILVYAWPFSAWGLFTWVQMASDRWSLQAFASNAEVGAYAALFQLGYTPIVTATMLLATVLSPILNQRSGDATDVDRNAAVHAMSWRIVWISLSGTVCGFVLTLALHGQIWSLLVAGPYRAVSVWLPWLVLAGGMFASGQLLSLKLLAALRPQRMVPAKIVTAIFGAVANISGAWLSGLPGVVGAAVVFAASYLAWIMFASREAGPDVMRCRPQ